MPRNYDHITSDVPWERNQESPQAFAAFACYRDAGPERSIRSVARAVGKNPTLIATWSVKHRWVERAAAWDAYCDAEERKATVKAKKDMAKKQVEIASRMLDRGAFFLDKLDEAKAAEVVQMIVNAAKLQRLALGEPTESTHTEVTGKDGGPVRVVSWAEAAVASVEGAKGDGDKDEGAV